MFYQSASDMFLDNRRGLEDDIKHLGEEDKERVLCAYDWAVSRFLTFQKSYQILTEEIDRKFGVGTVEEVEKETVRRCMELVEATKQYYEDVESGKLVGYSAEEQ